MKYLALLCMTLFVTLTGAASAQSGTALSADEIEKKVDSVMQRMTFEEKARLCIGGETQSFSGVPRLGIPGMTCADGPRGPKHPKGTAFPAGSGQSSTWNVDLLEQMGEVMGKETRAKSATVLLGPAINILRDPLDGRFFEYFTEDPYLNGALTAGIVKGIQSQKVAACLKHFACNNRELNRNSYLSQLDERTLREIYLPGFQMGVEAGAWTVMTAANGVNGYLSSDNRHLLTDILKNEWGFDGFVMTDWCGTRSTELAANAGLDVSMPWRSQVSYKNHLFGQPLLDAVKEGKVSKETIEDKARRVLRIAARTGVLDSIPQTQGGMVNVPAHHEIARQIAEESTVLLKNNGLLPLNPKQIKKILVIGPNADKHFCGNGFGGSSGVVAVDEVTALRGIREAAGKEMTITTFPMEELMGFRPVTADDLVADADGSRGFQAEYRKQLGGAPIYTEKVNSINFVWEMASPDVSKLGTDHFFASYVGQINPPMTGLYTLCIRADDSAKISYKKTGKGAPVASVSPNNPEAFATVHMTQGVPHTVRVDYEEVEGDAYCQLFWALPTSSQSEKLEELSRLAKKVDAVIFIGGLDHAQDTEGLDRKTMEFPPAQITVIRALAAANPNTTVVLINGSPMELGKWINDVPAVLESWYNGEAAGTAIGKILFGEVNPSGRLPFTWPNTLAESPAHSVGTETVNEVNYNEGIFVGYRYYDKMHITPQFPFGFGLSYTTFAFEKLTVSPGETSKYPFTAAVTVRNTGKMAGKEVVQVYASDVKSCVEQPVKELAGFAKIEFQQNEVKTVQIPLFWTAFQYYDTNKTAWVLEPGAFNIHAGDSSQNLPLTETVTVK